MMFTRTPSMSYEDANLIAHSILDSELVNIRRYLNLHTMVTIMILPDCPSTYPMLGTYFPDDNLVHIYINTILKHSKYKKPHLFEEGFLKILVHELTHAKQYEEDPDMMSKYKTFADHPITYFFQAYEKEANTAAEKYFAYNYVSKYVPNIFNMITEFCEYE